MHNATSIKVSSLMFLIAVSFIVSGKAAVQLASTVAPGALVAQVAADTVKPTNPSNLIATPGTNSVTLAWATSTDNVAVTGYRVFRNSAIVATSTKNTFTDTNLISNVKYTYFVRAIDAANNVSNNSNTVAATTTIPAVGGSTGAVSITADFGAKCNGVDSDTPAFASFNAWALEWQKTHSATIHLALPAGGTCYFNEGGDAGWIARWWVKGIKKVIVDGNGATLKNGPLSTGFFLGSSAEVQDGNHSARLETANAGATTLTIKDASKQPLFVAGNWVLITGYDLQGLWGSPYGYPSNAHFFEYVQIASVSGNTITLTAPLKNSYLSTWPNYNSGNAWEVDNGGPATLYALDPSWDSEHTFKNMTIDGGSMGQMYAGGKLAAFENVTFPGAAVIPTQNGTFIYDHVTTSAYIEVDKLIGSVIIKNSTIGSIDYQSSSVDTLTVTDSEFLRFHNGTPKKASFTNVKFKDFGVGTLYYGHTDEVTCVNCTVTGTFGTFGFNIDTTGWTMTNGVIKVPNTAHSLPWAIPGSHLFLSGSQGPSTSFNVVGVTQDATYTYVQTDLTGGWPTIPLAAGGSPKIQAIGAPKFTCTNCTGNVDVADLSQAPVGAPLYSYTKRTFSGNVKSQTGGTVRGKLVSFKINVTKPYTGTKASLSLEAFGQFGKFLINTSDGSIARIDPLINMKIAGERVITPATTTGQQAGDAISRSEPSSAATMPFKNWNIWISSGIGVFLPDLSADDPSTWPIFTVEIITDQGFGSGTGAPQGGGQTQPASDTTAPTVTITGPSASLSAGTTQASLAATTNESATCRYSTNASAAYTAMTAFGTTGATTHSVVISGLTNGTSYTYYVKCQDSTGNVSGNSTVTFAVAGAVADTTAPTVPSSLAATAQSSSQINLTWSASTDAVGVAGYKVFRAGVQIATTTATTFSNTGLTASTSYSYTVKAFDAANNVSASSTAAVATTLAAAVDVTAPSITFTAPASTLAVGTTQTTINATSNEAASCRYSTNSGAAYSAMTAFTTTGATTHSFAVSGLTNGTSYTYFVKCQDTAGNISNNVSVTFSVAAVAADTTAPSVHITEPTTNQAAGTTQTKFSATTNEAASCRYSANASAAYNVMTAFATTGATTHSTLLTGLTNSTTYTYFVKCQDTAGNTSGNASVTFAVAAAPSTSSTSSGGGGESSSTSNTTVTLPAVVITPSTGSSNASTGANTGVNTGGTKEGSNTTTSKPITFIPISHPLTPGSKGDDVRTLQKVLAYEKLLPTSAITGTFDLETQAAVQAFQTKYNIVLSGTPQTTSFGAVGPATRAALNAKLPVVAAATATSTPAGSGTASGTVTTSTGSGAAPSGITITTSLGFGTKKAAVAALQTYLSAKGYVEPDYITGYFGVITKGAVQKYQCDVLQICSGSESTTGYGYVGPKTRAAINEGK